MIKRPDIIQKGHLTALQGSQLFTVCPERQLTCLVPYNFHLDCEVCFLLRVRMEHGQRDNTEYLFIYLCSAEKSEQDRSWLRRCNSSWSPTTLLKWGRFCSNWNSTFLWCGYIFPLQVDIDIYNHWAEYRHNTTVQAGNGYFEWSHNTRNFYSCPKEAATLRPHYFSLSQGCPNSESCDSTYTHCPVPKLTLGNSYLLSPLCLYCSLLFFFRLT